MALFEVDGLNELRAALRDVDPKVDRALMAGLRGVASQVRDRANSYAPRKSGDLQAKTSITGSARAGKTNVSVKWLVPYAGVQEFATTYQRTRLGKTGTVHMRNEAPPPRFVYRAAREMNDTIGKAVFEAAAKALRAAGLDVTVE